MSFLKPTTPIASMWYDSSRFKDKVHIGKDIPYIVTFIIILAFLKGNQYLFFTHDTSPAILLLPTGVSIAAIYLAGYRMVIPIFIAWLLSVVTGPVSVGVLMATFIAGSYSLQAVVGAYLLTQFGFVGSMARTRGALVLVGVSLFVTAIAPTLVSGVQLFTQTLSTSFWTSLSRAWAGGVLNALIYIPLITTWWKYEHVRNVRARERVEAALGLTLLVAESYVLFWTELGRQYSFIGLYALIGTLFWISLRMRPRIMSLALFAVTVLGAAGVLIADTNAIDAVNTRLFSVELFMILIAPIFYILTSLVEEKSIIAQEVRTRADIFEEANRRLAQEDESKNEFLAILAHELRNPLAPVVSSLELARLKAVDRPDITKLLATAESHSRTLSRLLDDLLDISRITRKKFALQKEVVELHGLVERATQAVETLYRAKKHTLSISLPREKIWIDVDPLRIEQILVNILTNAGKYTNPGGHVWLSVSFKEGEGLHIIIRDNGKGIEPGLLPKIFDPFMQGRGDSSAGLGIGLSLTQRLVELHDGRVFAESKGKDKGSTFTVVLPPETVQMPEGKRARSGSHARSGIKNKKNGKQSYRILVVDDNAAAADGLCKLLAHNEHRVRVAYDGASALEDLRFEKADVVILDIGLPDMTGYEVAAQMRATYGDTPKIIALTGYGQAEDKARAEAAGFDKHLTKPVGIADIEEVLHELSTSPGYSEGS